VTDVVFSSPLDGAPEDARHHGEAAAANVEATTTAITTLTNALNGTVDTERILLRAAAGAGKSYALKRMVDQSLSHQCCDRVGVTAFTNKQILPLAEDIGGVLGRDRVCLRVSAGVFTNVPDSVRDAVTVVDSNAGVPPDAEVIIATASMFGRIGWRLRDQLGTAADGQHLFDVLFVDEAWQLAQHLYRPLVWLGRVAVGVGDVGQLPPLDPGQNPWRGDRGYNPYRAWPTAYERDSKTWSVDLPAVWRPTAAQLQLWRAFYPDWGSLDCVAASGDRKIVIGETPDGSAGIWRQVATGVPTIVEVAGLPDPEAPDVDPLLLTLVEDWLDALFTAGFELHEKEYDDVGVPIGDRVIQCHDAEDRTLVAVLATRNQAVDDAQEMVQRLAAKHDLPASTIVASTVDSWQGQTNAVTVAVHPLSGASRLDDFNSAFGRLAVTCTRATHGLLLVSRAGLNEMLATAPARPGTPMGEPGTRQLPRQMHERIIRTFARGTLAAA
jgi:hypothetical protein